MGSIMLDKSDIYLRLQNELNKLPIGFPKTESGVEIKLLKYLFTEREAEFAINLSFLPENINVIFKRVKDQGFTKKEIKEILDNLVKKGAILSLKYENEEMRYGKTMLVVGIFELQGKRMTKEFMEYFNQYIEEGFGVEMYPKGKSQVRAIPVEKSISTKHNIMNYDNVRQIIEDHSDSIAVMDCICRKGEDLLGKTCQHTDLLEVCLSFEKIGEHYIDQGYARQISKEECFKILDKTEKAGLVLQPSNAKDPMFICICCGCCCAALKTVKELPKPAKYYNNNYFAVVNTTYCNGCKICETRCQMGAIEVINKVSTVDLNRCIGCGLCVTTCKPQAIKLKRKRFTRKPQNNATNYYVASLAKIDRLKFIRVIYSRLFHKKI